MLIDASQEVSEQDQRVLNMILEAGKALVIAFNKWDLVDEDRRYYLDREIDENLRHLPWVTRVNISAETGRALQKLVYYRLFGCGLSPLFGAQVPRALRFPRLAGAHRSARTRAPSTPLALDPPVCFGPPCGLEAVSRSCLRHDGGDMVAHCSAAEVKL